MSLRNCDADPRRTEPVMHPKLPAAVSAAIAEPTCPMRVFQDPRVAYYLEAWARARRWGVLLRAGGLEDQRPADLEALDLIDAVMRVPVEGLD